MAASFSILIAEPNLLLREKIAGVLARDKRVWCVIQVEGSKSLLRGVLNLKPDFILADLSLLMDPNEVNDIRNISRKSQIIALVETDSDPYAEMADRLGLDGVMEKGRVVETMRLKIGAHMDETEKSND